MKKDSIAYRTLWPTDSKIVVRVCFLYVGQGSSVLVLVRDGITYRAFLADVNLDRKHGGIDVPEALKDLLPDDTLRGFINTHPHDDHLSGLDELKAELTIETVWHTGFDPGSKSGDHYKHLVSLIDDLAKKSKDDVVEMDGTRTSEALFDAEVHYLAPAEHVKDDINAEKGADKRYDRIHEHCAVLKFGKAVDDKQAWVLVTGDADLAAFRDHITTYHKDRLPAFVLDASHHGSRSFFKEDEKDDPYLDALEAINPDYVVISAPTVEESAFDHPHADAVKLYSEHVGKKNVLHTGKDRESFIFDVYEDGTSSKTQSDNGALAEEYGLDQDDEGGDGGSGGGGGGSGGKKAATVGPFVRPSESGEFKPKKYA